jgi:integrin alpha FG-GAP repeat containing protein 1
MMFVCIHFVEKIWYSVPIQAFVRINLTSLFPSSPYLLMNDMTHDPSIPLPIRVGDFSLDGFPDLIPIVASAPKGGVLGIGTNIERTPYLLTSVPCARGVAGCGASGQGRRGFRIATAGSEALQQIVDARGVTVLDLDEDVCSVIYLHCYHFENITHLAA